MEYDPGRQKIGRNREREKERKECVVNKWVCEKCILAWKGKREKSKR